MLVKLSTNWYHLLLSPPNTIERNDPIYLLLSAYITQYASQRRVDKFATNATATTTKASSSKTKSSRVKSMSITHELCLEYVSMVYSLFEKVTDCAAACWASSGYNVAGCQALETQLRACMDAPVWALIVAEVQYLTSLNRGQNFRKRILSITTCHGCTQIL